MRAGTIYAIGYVLTSFVGIGGGLLTGWFVWG